jgi:hypothetical protein
LDNRQDKSFQGETGERIRTALRALSGLGFSLPKIRKVAIGLNDYPMSLLRHVGIIKQFDLTTELQK